MNKVTNFTAANMTLAVVARSSKKKGIFVFVRTKVGKEKAKLGMRQAFEATDEAGAVKRYDELVEKTKAKGGWTLGATKAGSTGGFSDIPDAPTANVPEGEPAAKVGQKKKK